MLDSVVENIKKLPSDQIDDFKRLPMEKQYQYLKDAPLDEYPSRIRDIYQQMY